MLNVPAILLHRASEMEDLGPVAPISVNCWHVSCHISQQQ